MSYKAVDVTISRLIAQGDLFQITVKANQVYKIFKTVYTPTGKTPSRAYYKLLKI